jgi:deoxyadenosine/deoxycytidine kinase
MFICIEGNIGAGKTTLAKKIANEFKFDFLPEQFEENSLLPLFYNEPENYSYLLEFSFLIERFQQLTKWAKKLKTKHVVSDYNFYKCLCFAKINLSEIEYNFFEKEFYKLNKLIFQPDLLIKLHLQPDYLIKNINQRNRTAEKNIPESYLRKINESYDLIYSQTSLNQVSFHLKENSPEEYERIFSDLNVYLQNL